MTPAAPPGVFRKACADAPAGFFAREAAGLDWLRVDGGPRIVGVSDVGPGHLDLERLSPVTPTPAAARAFGGALATLHDAGAPAFGAGPGPAWGWSGEPGGWFGPLRDPLPMPGGVWRSWPEFYAEARLRPLLGQGRERGVLGDDDARLIDAVCARLPRLAGPSADDEPARLHGDLWSGNVLWVDGGPPAPDSAGGPAPGAVDAVLIDPAAYGGHRETDLAMLALFGAPHLAEILAGYQDVHPLARGWQHRVRLHQLYPLAVHAVLFGGSYVPETRSLLAELAG
ncbi:fructosamine kinase family protein [Promicromonospora panici]|uniref:fructosamine kinase family protein n=1 Tax=Promicromonospora panici TaxID=2219658 RepID=UPI001F5DB76B|nr:fructosamine kinase family protein [Promicromonospora panici]